MDETGNLMSREKMLQYGIEALAGVELLALFLRAGMRCQDAPDYVQASLQRLGSLYALPSTDKARLITADGLGLAKYAQLKGIAKLARRYSDSQLVGGAALAGPPTARGFLRSQLTEEKREIFVVIFLDSQNRMLRHSRFFPVLLATLKCIRERLHAKSSK